MLLHSTRWQWKYLSKTVIARNVFCDVAISFHTFLNNEKMRSSRLQKAKLQDDTFGVRWDPHALTKRGLRMTDEKHPPRRESGTPPRRGIVDFIPPLRGDSGGCAFLFFVSSLFTYSFIFRIDLNGYYDSSCSLIRRTLAPRIFPSLSSNNALLASSSG